MLTDSNSLRVRLTQDDFRQYVFLRLWKFDEERLNVRLVVTGLTFNEVESRVAMYDDHNPIALTNEMSQSLMDQLWDCGFRPTEGTGSAGAMSAAQNHLKELSGIANRLLALVEKTHK